MAESKKTGIGKRNVERAAKSDAKSMKQGKVSKIIATAKKKEQTLTMAKRPEQKKEPRGDGLPRGSQGIRVRCVALVPTRWPNRLVRRCGSG